MDVVEGTNTNQDAVIAGKLSDAPVDGSTYARKDAAWVPVTSGGGSGAAATFIGDSPPPTPVVGQLWWQSSTGIMFIRFDDLTSVQWVQVVPSGIQDAPLDGHNYVRRNGVWAELSTVEDIL